MHFEELLKIKTQIESTKSESGLGIGDKEFAWSYESEQGLKCLEERCSLSGLLLGGPEHAVEYVAPTNTNATVLIHNHPGGDVSPSYWDLISFLSSVSGNSRMRYSLIASTERGRVSGYLVMAYIGRRARASALKRKISKRYNDLCNLRQQEIRTSPEEVRWGENIFTVDERRKISLELRSTEVYGGKITEELVPMPGYQSKRYRFVRNG